MNLSCAIIKKHKIKCDLLVLVTETDAKIDFKYFSTLLTSDLKAILANLKLSDKGSDTFISLENQFVPNLLLIKIACSASDSLEEFRQAGFSILQHFGKIKGKNIHLYIHNVQSDLVQVVRGLTEGLLLSEYKFLEYKTTSSDDALENKGVTFFVEKQNDFSEIRRELRRSKTIIDGVNSARSFANKPANILTPKKMAREVQKLFRSMPTIKVENIQGKKLESSGMNAFLAVAKGSNQNPAFILMKYKSGIKGAQKLAIVGKGITFDSGGISIKPAQSMEDMKFDMAGAAAVIGLFKVISVLKPEIDIIGAIPAAENALGGDAYRPGDILRSFSGKTIEVINTDAEGRLILADALSYIAKRYHPDWMIDIATLTGSIVSALGDQCSGIFSTNDTLLQSFRHGAEKSGERVWPMPMWDEYKKPLESKVADIKHLGDRSAGSITAAKFLEYFVSDIPWIHMDIAGTAYNIKSKKYLGDGASGYGVRLMWEVIAYLQKATKK